MTSECFVSCRQSTHSLCVTGKEQGKYKPSSLLLVTHSSIVSSQAKIALKGTSEEQLLELEAIAKSLNLCARSIIDAYVLVFLLAILVDTEACEP